VHRWLPENISTYGADIDSLFYVVYYLTGVTFLLVAGVMLYYLVKYRDRGDGRRAIYTHGNGTLEVVWTVIPAVIFVILGISSESVWAKIKKDIPEPDLEVRIHGKQFNWEIYYPGPDGELGTADDPKPTENMLRVPLNKKVVVNLTAEDVIHSFFVPQIRLKQDALPGRQITVWFEATKAGRYEIACAELCGFGHTTMQGFLQVLDPDPSSWDKPGKSTVKRSVKRGWPTALLPAGL